MEKHYRRGRKKKTIYISYTDEWTHLIGIRFGDQWL